MPLRSMFHSILQVRDFVFFELSVLRDNDNQEKQFCTYFKKIETSYFFCDRLYSTHDFKIHGPFLVDKLSYSDFTLLEEDIFDDISKLVTNFSGEKSFDNSEKMKLLYVTFVPPSLKWYTISYKDGGSIGLNDERYFVGNSYSFYQSYVGYNKQDVCIIKLYLD